MTAEASDVAVTVEPPTGVTALARLVGLAPMRHHNTATPPEDLDGVGRIPGFVPDPLLADTSVTIGPLETRSFWVTLRVDPDAPTGFQSVTVAVSLGQEPIARLATTVHVHQLVSAGLRGFPVTHWFYADAIADRYGVAPFSARFWPIAERYMRNLTAHGGTCQYVPVFTPPTDGVKRPTQLLRVSQAADGAFDFDFADVRKWVRMARRCGAEFFEWTHLFTQWGAARAIRVYRRNADESSLLWPPETPACAPVYRDFLRQFLPKFHRFLDAEGILDVSHFHVSDEPSIDHVENYRAAREMLRALAPWMRVCDAVSDIEFGKLGLIDIPIPSIHAASQYAAAGIPSWTYFCCGPRGRYLNRFMDTPLGKIRMAGRLLHRLGAQGFLHWGYNYWYRSQTRELIDPFTEQSGAAWPGLAYGDPFVVYPGPDGPLDSIRWEVWSEAMQDLAILRQLGVSAEDRCLTGIRGYDDFPWREPLAPLPWPDAQP